jgi:hypothetical protein
MNRATAASTTHYNIAEIRPTSTPYSASAVVALWQQASEIDRARSGPASFIARCG